METLKNFFNEISNNTRVFTAEDIGAMNSDEFSQNESAIDYQLKTLGIPFNRDLSGNDDVVFVNAYTRSDGTEVKAHYRSKAGHYGSSFAPYTDSMTTGGIAGNDSGMVLDERMGYHDSKTGKKVYYDGVMHLKDNGVPTGGAADVMDNTQQTPLQGGIEMNDYSNLYRQLLQGTLPELKDWSTKVLEQMNLQKGIHDKKILDIGINNKITHSLFPNATNFWNITSQSIDRNMDYINRNGSIFNKISDLPKEYQDYARDKVGSQFGLNDCKGIIFHENSEVSKALERSNAINTYIKNNFDKLASGQVIKNDSLGFEIQDFDTMNAIGKCDILEAKMIDREIEITIGDTYDFNKNSNNPLVRWGRSAQNAGLLEPYYSIIKIKVKL